MSNKTQLQTNNTKYASLIETLRGKAAGGSGEDVSNETNAYTSKISQLETAVTALEAELEGKASGGSGGASIETCTVKFNNLTCNYVAQIINNNSIQIDYKQNVMNANIENVMKGSMLYVDCSALRAIGVIVPSTVNIILMKDDTALYQINGDCTFSLNEDFSDQ